MNLAWLRRVLVVLSLGAVAPAHALTIEQHPDLATFIDDMVARHGFDAPTLRRWFSDVELHPNIVRTMERPREQLPWHKYRKGFVNDERTRWGLAYWKRHETTLARAEHTYGVPAEIILAIIGVETAYGRNKGRFTSLDALTTLSLTYPRRAPFFRRELEEFLLLVREFNVEPRTVVGSYAGAVGIPQFIPSSYRAYAVDFDQDGRRDLFNNDADAIGSVANFLRQHGWVAGQPISDPAAVNAPTPLWLADFGSKPLLPLRQWSDSGVIPQRPVTNSIPGDGDRMAALILLQGDTGPLYHLAYNNFYVITRYNRSFNYAMAVTELGQALRTRRLENK